MIENYLNINILPILIVLFPLLGFVVCGVNALVTPSSFGSSAGTVNRAGVSGALATATIFISFLLGVYLWQVLSNSPSSSLGSTVVQTPSYLWLEIASVKLNFQLILDRLNIILVLIITGVGGIIHLYSIGYMSEDRTPSRYFAYLNLFCFFMLVLVCASSLPLMFFGWEGVGLCSYLLIGYWYEDLGKAKDGSKAFIMNRIGDVGLLLAMFFIYRYYHTFEFRELLSMVEGGGTATATSTTTLIVLLLFAGAVGKSAQIPLATWLPSAMSGPTPVSALIHAATMVTAGVFLMVRVAPLLILSPVAMKVIAVTGVVTALWASTIAIAQNDIKKVLAYSTVSQLGLMFISVGVGAFSTAIFHLTTHAFFKALLFLSAGSVIHACDGEQDMRKMGKNLRNKIPVTFVCTLVGALALSGIPIFSGFFSKDEMMYAILVSPLSSPLLFISIAVTSLLTAVYSGRMIAITFWGSANQEFKGKKSIHESPLVMIIPLIILSLLSLFGGILGLPHWTHFLKEWLQTVVVDQEITAVFSQEIILMVVSSLLAIIAFILGKWLFSKHYTLRAGVQIQKFLEESYYLDQLYAKLLLNPYQKVSEGFSKYLDNRIFHDGLQLIYRPLLALSQSKKYLQSGELAKYSAILWVGVFIILLLTVVLMFWR